MKALFFLLLSGFALADLPRLTIEHGSQRQDSRVDEVEVTVRVEGDFVETRMSLNFYNENPLSQEGEFLLPLPEGASVNHYALEVNGKMRAATVVEKEQARRAYETIKAGNIDPGLVEKMEGNVYRTRIFPVLPKQGKRVSIGYVQPFQKSGDEWVYRLPFGVTEKIGKFQLKIEGDLAEIDTEMTGGVELQKEENGFSYSTTNSPVEGDLVIKRKSKADEFVGEIREVNGESYAYVTGPLPPKLADQKVRKPEIVTVIWDASASGYVRNIKTEMEFLGKLLAELGEVTVQLMAVQGEMENLGEFQVKGGDWKKLRAAVEGIFHDGAADWRKLDFTKLDGERIILFGAVESAVPISQTKIGEDFYVVRSGAEKVEKVFAEMAIKTGGGVIDLTNLKVADAVSKALEPMWQVQGVEGAVESSFSEIIDGQVRIFAKMSLLKQEMVVVNLSTGSGSGKPITVKLKRAEGGSALRYLWAQRKLDDMTRQSSLITGKEKASIITHCQSYGLVSDFTSLIVLERMQDHIQFRIPPPEPELMEEYQKGIENAERLRKEREHHGALFYAWRNRVRWHEKRFPWVEVALLPRYERVKKWTDAQTSVFAKEQLEQTNVAEFLAWKKEAEQVIREGDEIASQKSFLDWNLKIAHLMETGKQLGAKDVALPEKGEFGVSVRGLVKEPQTLTLKNGATLRDVIKITGGVLSSGSESRVALYRSGKRTVYNLLSKEYVDIKLLPGDMVVAMSDYNHQRFDDPFAAFGGSDRGNVKQHQDNPALVDGDIPLVDRSPKYGSGDESLSAGLPGGEDPSMRERERSDDLPLLQGVVQEAGKNQATNEELIAEMLKAEDFWVAYQKGRPKMADNIADYTRVAEELYKRKEPKKAGQVLSNIHALRGFHVPSLRATAYWMMEFKDFEGAMEIFEMIAMNFPDDGLLALDVMRLQRIAEGAIPESRFRGLLGTETAQALIEPGKSMFADLVMMERNRFRVKPFEGVTSFLPKEREVFSSDIRIVVTCSDSDNRTYLQITEPTETSIAGNDISSTGGRMVSGDGVAEFMIRRAMPGEYRLQLANVDRGVYQMEIFLNWGRANETRRMFTISGDGKGRMIDAGVVKFDLGQR